MSLAARLGRILRAQLGAWRPDADRRTGASGGAGRVHAEAEAPAGAGQAKTAVPPEVAAAYRALEVPAGSDRQAVRKSYRRLMKTYHPDRFARDSARRATARELAQRLNAAYERVTAYLDARDA